VGDRSPGDLSDDGYAINVCRKFQSGVKLVVEKNFDDEIVSISTDPHACAGRDRTNLIVRSIENRLGLCVRNGHDFTSTLDESGILSFKFWLPHDPESIPRRRLLQDNYYI
jgi:hypothetical protein